MATLHPDPLIDGTGMRWTTRAHGLAALGRHDELAIYTQGAVRNGVTVDEITEILVHVTAYCGTPAGRQAFLSVRGGLEEAGAID